MSAATDAPAFTLTNPAGLYDPSANGYSHLAEVPAGTRLVFVAGQGGETEKAELSPDFRAQVRQAFANLRIALQAPAPARRRRQAHRADRGSYGSEAARPRR